MLPPRLIASLPDRYAFERELGQGGMATVYLADDIKHHRKVAIKLLRPELAATVGPERFLREIRIAAQLQHPHILPLLESGEADGFLYYVMPYVDGESLRHRLVRQGELPVHEALRLLTEIVDALSYAHARGVVHRDIKPDNVMVSGRHALVMDFGVAKAVSEASGRNQLTTAGVALGTPAYMAPEQAAADPHLDHRVDIYAVGAMAYELLAGRPPFVGGTPQQVLAAHVTQPAEPLSRHRPGVSAALEAVVMRCLAKRPADRWQTADELLAQLESLLTPSGGMTPTSTRPIQGWSPDDSAKKRWIGVGVALLVTLVALAWWLWPESRSASRAQLDRAQLTFTGNATAPSLAPDGRRIAFAERTCDSTGMCTADVVVQDIGGAGSARVLTGALNVWQTSWTRDGRYLLVGASLPDGWGNFSVPTLGGGVQRRLGQGAARLVGDGDTTLVTWALPQDTVAWFRRVGTADGTVYDSVPWRIEPGSFPGLQVTPNGRWLIIHSELDTRSASKSVVSIADRSGRAQDSIVFPHTRVREVHPLPGSRSLVVFSVSEGNAAGLDAVVYRIDEKGRIDERPDTVARQLDIFDPGIGPGGELVALTGSLESSVWSFHWDDPGSRPQLALKRLAASRSIAVTGSVSPDGRQVFLVRDVSPGAQRLRRLSVMPIDSGPERNLGNPLAILDWDWGDNEVIIAVRRGDSVGINSVNPANGQLRLLRTYHGDRFAVLEAIPGGGFVFYPASGDRVHRVLQPGRPDTVFRFPRAFGIIVAMEPSPDGTALATAGWDERGDSIVINRVSLTDGSFRRVAALAGEDVENPRWLPNGDLIFPVQETIWTVAFYRVSSEGGVPTRLGLAPRVPGSYRFSADGKRGIVRIPDRSTDVVVIRNFGEVAEQTD